MIYSIKDIVDYEDVVMTASSLNKVIPNACSDRVEYVLCTKHDK